jgi:hypothetical protein
MFNLFIIELQIVINCFDPPDGNTKAIYHQCCISKTVGETNILPIEVSIDNIY